MFGLGTRANLGINFMYFSCFPAISRKINFYRNGFGTPWSRYIQKNRWKHRNSAFVQFLCTVSKYLSEFSIKNNIRIFYVSKVQHFKGYTVSNFWMKIGFAGHVSEFFKILNVKAESWYFGTHRGRRNRCNMSILDMWSVENIILHWIHVSIIVGHLRSHKKIVGDQEDRIRILIDINPGDNDVWSL